LAVASISLASGLSDARFCNIFRVAAILLAIFVLARVLKQGRAAELAPVPVGFQRQSFSVRQEVAHYPDPTTASLH
jgi:hypothetical protein